MLKIKLLNSGGYKSLDNLKFPVVVDGFLDPRYPGLTCVCKREIKKCGAEIELSGLSFSSRGNMKIYLPELGIYANICDNVKRFYMYDDKEYFVKEINGEIVAVSENYQDAP